MSSRILIIAVVLLSILTALQIAQSAADRRRVDEAIKTAEAWKETAEKWESLTQRCIKDLEQR